MKLEDIQIGQFFYGPAGFKWLCTDKGSRVIVAIMLDEKKEDYWFNGPPYSVEEKVFDEHDLKLLYLNHDDMLLDRIDDLNHSSHPGFLGNDFFKMIKERNRDYPEKKLLKIDRVSKDGYIFHPYSAVKKENFWFIKVFELFSKEFLEILESEFVQLPFCTEDDLRKRKENYSKNL